MEILFASKNKGKIAEVSKILSGDNIKLLSFLDFSGSPDVQETGATFRENAELKAIAAFEAFGIPSIADDSGISVEQLNGAPGVYSARYAAGGDEENNLKLLNELQNFPEPHKAKFICAAVFYNGVKLLHASGEIAGRVIDKPRGKNGFGYDPLFVPDGYTITTAEMDPAEKNKISHRAIAFNKLYELIIKETIR
jgi:XTP/dITP diphosphohydrolase